MKALKAIIAKNPRIDTKLLKESIKLSRRLAKLGAGGRKGYSLPSPYENRMVKSSISDLVPDKEC